MIIMALDHVRDFVHRAAMVSSPTDLAKTTPFLFLTRWITHFCAPVFVFTAGMGAFLWWQHRRPRRQLRRSWSPVVCGSSCSSSRSCDWPSTSTFRCATRCS